MTKQILIVCACLALSHLAIAINGDPNKTNDPPAKTTSAEKPLAPEKIFLGDVEERVLFVDFAVVPEKISVLNLYRDGQLMLQDEVSDLPRHTIYEVNLDVIRSGTYLIELVTDRDVKIQKEFFTQ